MDDELMGIDPETYGTLDDETLGIGIEEEETV
jgi:hypothetical protein